MAAIHEALQELLYKRDLQYDDVINYLYAMNCGGVSPAVIASFFSLLEAKQVSTEEFEALQQFITKYNYPKPAEFNGIYIYTDTKYLSYAYYICLILHNMNVNSALCFEHSTTPNTLNNCGILTPEIKIEDTLTPNQNINVFAYNFLYNIRNIIDVLQDVKISRTIYNTLKTTPLISSNTAVCFSDSIPDHIKNTTDSIIFIEEADSNYTLADLTAPNVLNDSNIKVSHIQNHRCNMQNTGR